MDFLARVKNYFSYITAPNTIQGGVSQVSPKSSVFKPSQKTKPQANPT